MKRWPWLLALSMISTPVWSAPFSFLTSASVSPLELPTLGPSGPLGALGPLGAVGPIGRNPWNPCLYVQAFGDIVGTSVRKLSATGPLSAAGPLGESGPLGRMFPHFPIAYQPGHRWAVLGPAGPLGSLGPTGPLGPLGPHGLKIDSEGRYRDRGRKVVRRIDVPYTRGKSRNFPLVEYLTAPAASKTVNDTSFLVSDQVSPGEEKTFRVRAEADEWLTILLVPEIPFTGLGLELTDANGVEMAHTGTTIASPWIHGQVEKDSEWTVKIRTRTSAARIPFRLIITSLELQTLPSEDEEGL